MSPPLCPRPLLSFVGLVPRDDSSGEEPARERITQTGDAHLRWALVEAAWHYEHRPGLTKAIQACQAGHPAGQASASTGRGAP